MKSLSSNEEFTDELVLDARDVRQDEQEGRFRRGNNLEITLMGLRVLWDALNSE